MFQKQDFTFYDLNDKIKTNEISLIFPDWQGENERIMVFSPHDDDALLGAAYIMRAVQFFGGKVYVTIFMDGSTGYSNMELKDKIVETRKKETKNAFKKLEIREDCIFRFEIPDFSGLNFLGWKHVDGKEGIFRKIVTLLRRLKISRLIIPNGYREHHDHTAIFISGIFDGIQAGDPISMDWGEPTKIETFLIYNVWGKFSPEDALINNRPLTIRGNLAIAVNKNIEINIQDALKQFKSQSQIIEDILSIRKDRKLKDGKYLEVYLKMFPRPRFDIKPYIKLITEIDNNELG